MAAASATAVPERTGQGLLLGLGLSPPVAGRSFAAAAPAAEAIEGIDGEGLRPCLLVGVAVLAPDASANAVGRPVPALAGPGRSASTMRLLQDARGV